MLSRFHLIQERNGQTDKQTDGRTNLLYQYRASVCLRAIKSKQLQSIFQNLDQSTLRLRFTTEFALVTIYITETMILPKSVYLVNLLQFGGSQYTNHRKRRLSIFAEGVLYAN